MNKEAPEQKTIFPGQQTGEKVISIIKPSKFVLAWMLFTKFFLAALVAFAWFRIEAFLPEYVFSFPNYFLYVLIFAVFIVLCSQKYFIS